MSQTLDTTLYAEIDLLGVCTSVPTYRVSHIEVTKVNFSLFKCNKNHFFEKFLQILFLFTKHFTDILPKKLKVRFLQKDLKAAIFCSN